MHANVLIHEATFAAGDEELAYNYFHSTAKEAAEIAKTASAERLILSHISSRYQGDAVSQLAEGAKEIFPNTDIAEDLKGLRFHKKPRISSAFYHPRSY